MPPDSLPSDGIGGSDGGHGIDSGYGIDGPASRTRPGPGLRLLDALTGLLAAGVLVVGVVLLLAALIAPAALAAAGLGPAAGPGWDRVLAHLTVGVAGELVVRLRGRWSGSVRVLADLAVLVAAVAVLWWGWWA